MFRRLRRRGSWACSACSTWAGGSSGPQPRTSSVASRPTRSFSWQGAVLYWLLPTTGSSHLNSVPLFVLMAGLLISMYGGGFATIPAYLKDLFGGYHVSAIHGRLLTAWATAGIVGPLIVNGILDHYVAQAYSQGTGLSRDPAYHGGIDGSGLCGKSAGAAGGGEILDQDSSGSDGLGDRKEEQQSWLQIEKTRLQL